MIALLVISCVVLAGFIWLLRMPSAYTVERSVYVPAAPAEVFRLLQDFAHWPSWSPWLLHDASTALTFSDSTDQVDSFYTWSSALIGSGKVTHLSLDAPREIRQQLEFYKPFKSRSQVTFQLTEKEGDTRLCWRIQGRLPLLMRWMAGKMDRMIGKDFELGLARLRTLACPGYDPVDVVFKGPIQTAWRHYVFTRYSGSFRQMSDFMRKEFTRMKSLAAENGVTLEGEPFTQYHQFQPSWDRVVVDLCLPVIAGQTLAGCETAVLGGRKYFRTEVRGDYHYLEQAWHAAFAQLKMRKLSRQKKAPLLERYVTDPSQTEGLERVTYLDIPV